MNTGSNREGDNVYLQINWRKKWKYEISKGNKILLKII